MKESSGKERESSVNEVVYEEETGYKACIESRKMENRSKER